LLSAHNFETAFLAAEDGVEEIYNPWGGVNVPLLISFSKTTVKCRFKDGIM
jgi:hypothetical protein